MSEILTPELKADLEAGINTIRSEEPTDKEKRDKAIAALFELQLKKAQSIEVRGLKLQGWLSIIAFSAIVISALFAVDVPECIRAWRCQP